MDEWVKMRRKLVGDPRVRKMSKTLRTPVHAVLGCLLMFWFLADEYADEDGYLPGYDAGDIDAHVGLPGFVKALPSDWCEERGGELYLLDYQEHNGRTAKRRSEDAKRKRHTRSASAKCPQNVRNEPDKMQTREEKRREEKNSKKPPTPLEKSWALATGFMALNSELYTDAFKAEWAEWDTFRRKINKKLTEPTIKRQIKKLEGFGHDAAIAVIEQSIDQGWAGLFELKDDKRGQSRRKDEYPEDIPPLPTL